MGGSVIEARVVMLALAVLVCAIAWCGRLLPVPIRNNLVRTLIGAGFGAAVGGILLAQIFLYRSMTGIRRGLGPFGYAVVWTECAVTIFLFVKSNRALRRKAARKGLSGIGG